MPLSPDYSPDPRCLQLGPEFGDPVQPANFPVQIERFRNQRWATRIGLASLEPEEFRAAFARFEPLPDNLPTPLALRYHGHQFRSYNPDLGDGRGFLFAQLREVRARPGAVGGRLLDLGTKGSGQTPYSRFGDGRLTLKGGVREVLATEMLEALGVPTSKSFALFETGEGLTRGDEPSPTRSSVLTRLSWSHIRFGTFQRLAYLDRPDLIAQLIGYVVEQFYPELQALAPDAWASGLLRAAAGRTSAMLARWMTAGFVHGVLNTDNMNINGESFDYGPYRFLPRNDPGFTAAYFDQTGLYAFGRQPEAVFWNLQQLAACFALVCPPEPLIDDLNSFSAAYREALQQAMLARLGVKARGPEADADLAAAAFAALAEGGEALRWEPLFFDWFGGDASAHRALDGPRASLYAQPASLRFRERLARYEPDRPERLGAAYFERVQPEELLYDEIEAIWAAIDAHDDWSQFERKLETIAAARDAWGLCA